jgi:paraquat-inducible protein B
MNRNTQLRFISIAKKWYVWLFPAFALVMCAWLFMDYYQQKGSTIEIVFTEASNLQPEKTKVKFKGVTIGTVTSVTLSEDFQNVVAKVVLTREAKRFAMRGAKYWVVIPKFSFQGISGLETLFSGSYIAASPPAEEAEHVDRFLAQDPPEDVDDGDGTSAYLLTTNNIEAVGVGDKVTFRGMKVGAVTKAILAKDSRTVHLQINVENRYAKIVRTNTMFWQKAGIYAKLGLFGSEIKINSLDTMMNSGVELFTPDNPGPMAKNRAQFELLPSPPKGWQKWNPALTYN